MLRSASLAAFDMLRVCCCSGARLSRPRLRLWRVTRRMHELHWGSSEDRLSEAIAGCVVAVLVLPKKDAGRSVELASGDPCDGLGPRTHGQARRWPCAWHSLCGRCLTEQAGDDCQQDSVAVRQQWRIETSHLHIPLCLHSPDKTSARASSPASSPAAALCTTHHTPVDQS